MKVCGYCRSENPDSAINCASCGGKEFQNKCNNCGTIIIGSYCQNCGVKSGDKGMLCQQCGKKFFSAACPHCGWKPYEKTYSQKVVENAYRPQYPAIKQHAVPKKKNVLFQILLWLFFLPIMLCILVAKSNMPQKSKTIIIILIVIITLIFAVISNDKQDHDSINEVTNESKQNISSTTTSNLSQITSNVITTQTITEMSETKFHGDK